MTGFFELFQPGLKHWREQQDLEKVLVLTDEAGGAGPEPLDLDSGSVVLRMPPTDSASTDSTDPAT